jgi:nicotinamidase-related amidase
MPLTLLVVGMQKDKVSAMARGGEENEQRLIRHDGRSDSICGEVNRCIDFALKKGWGVAFAMDMHHRSHCSFYNNGGALRNHCVIGTMGYDPVTGLRFGEAGMDMVCRGTEKDGDSSDAFWDVAKKCGSRLQSILSKEDGVVLCGTSPDGCIENTIATARERGIPVYIVAEAMWVLGEMPTGVQVLNLSSTDSC